MVRCPFRFGDTTKGLGRCLMWRERAMCAQGKGTGQQRSRPPPEGATSQRCCSGGPAPVARRQRARTTLDWFLGAGGQLGAGLSSQHGSQLYRMGLDSWMAASHERPQTTSFCSHPLTTSSKCVFYSGTGYSQMSKLKSFRWACLPVHVVSVTWRKRSEFRIQRDKEGRMEDGEWEQKMGKKVS